MEREIWLRTDEIEEFIDALEHAAGLAAKVKGDVKAWKWLIIALHSALQGACVCALRGHDTAGVTVLTRQSWKKVWHWLNVESRNHPSPPMPAEKLANLNELFARVCDPSRLPPPHTLGAADDAISDVNTLNRLRNVFIHFVPRGLSVELSGMPRIITHVADAIEHLAITQPTFWHHLGSARRARIAAALAALRAQVAAE